MITIADSARYFRAQVPTETNRQQPPFLPQPSRVINCRAWGAKLTLFAATLISEDAGIFGELLFPTALPSH